MPKPITHNTLFYGDNLHMLRDYVADESVDLIYLDPPFNSSRTYNVLFKQESGAEAEAQIAAFEDTWHWNTAAERTYYDLVEHGPPAVGQMIGARALAHDNRYQFQWWALSLVCAQPLGGEAGAKAGKKGADRGIDGLITFVDDAGGKVKRVIVQVESGKVGSAAVRDLVGVLNREGAALAVFVTLEEPTKEMMTEAAAAGFYRSEQWGRDYPRLQLLTVRELLAGAAVQMPPTARTFKQARREKEGGAEQKGLFD